MKLPLSDACREPAVWQPAIEMEMLRVMAHVNLVPIIV
jgi:hypothetical protein